MTKPENKSFTYTYCATHQKEVQHILQKYLPPEADKMEQFRKLDEQAALPGIIAALSLGMVSTLVLGFGMCCTMLWTQYFIPGIIIGIAGIAGVFSAYPVYTTITKHRRQKIAPEMIRLSKELMSIKNDHSPSPGNEN